MLAVTGSETEGYTIAANGHVICDGIPTEKAVQVCIKHIEASPINIDWAAFDGFFWAPDELALVQAIEAAEKEIEALAGV